MRRAFKRIYKHMVVWHTVRQSIPRLLQAVREHLEDLSAE